MEKLITAGEIVGVNYIGTFKRQGAFGNFEEETGSKDPFFISESINDKKDYKYFDKYGNLFTIGEIDNSVNEKTQAIQQAKAFLKENGYFIDNLWSIYDVKENYDCTDEQAQKVLNNALTNDYIVEQINISINEFADLENLKQKINYFSINGFWKDSKEKFSDYIVKESEEELEEEDDNIFYYGLSEEDIQEAIEAKWKTDLEFVITSYSKI